MNILLECIDLQVPLFYLLAECIVFRQGCFKLLFIGLLLAPDVRLQLFTGRLRLGNLLLSFLKLYSKGLFVLREGLYLDGQTGRLLLGVRKRLLQCGDLLLPVSIVGLQRF